MHIFFFNDTATTEIYTLSLHDALPIFDRCLHRLGIDELPIVLLSHLDADHVGGLAGALTGRDVGVVATGPLAPDDDRSGARSEEHTSELQSRQYIVCRLLLEKKNKDHI